VSHLLGNKSANHYPQAYEDSHDSWSFPWRQVVRTVGKRI